MRSAVGHWSLQECMDEMHMLGYIVKSAAAEMEVRGKVIN